MLEKYFGDESGRIYDMLNFLDFYGRKNNILRFESKKLIFVFLPLFKGPLGPLTGEMKQTDGGPKTVHCFMYNLLNCF